MAYILTQGYHGTTHLSAAMELSRQWNCCGWPPTLQKMFSCSYQRCRQKNISLLKMQSREKYFMKHEAEKWQTRRKYPFENIMELSMLRHSTLCLLACTSGKRQMSIPLK